MDDDSSQTAHLVESAQRGDRNALERLFERYLPRVRQIAALRLGRRLSQLLEVEDVVQAALGKAFEGLERFESRSEGGFRNWLSRCVECEIVDQSRRATARKRGSGDVRRFADYGEESFLSAVLAADAPSPSEIVRTAELEAALEKALLELATHHREVIILRFLCGMDYEEISHEMGFTKTMTARKACSRAVGKLRESLPDDGRFL